MHLLTPVYLANGMIVLGIVAVTVVDVEAVVDVREAVVADVAAVAGALAVVDVPEAVDTNFISIPRGRDFVAAFCLREA